MQIYQFDGSYVEEMPKPSPPQLHHSDNLEGFMKAILKKMSQES